MNKLRCYKNKFDSKDLLIRDSRALLHDYYVEHYGWNIPSESPSGLKVKVLNKKKILTDFYDQHSIFFSVVNGNNDMVSCARLCAGDRKNCLEIEKYENAKRRLQYIFSKKSEFNILEMTREGIKLNYLNDQKPYLLLLYEIFQFCLNGNYSLLTTTNLIEWENIYKYIGFPKLTNVGFKYFDHEPAEVSVYFALNNQIQKIFERIKFLLEKHGDENEKF